MTSIQRRSILRGGAAITAAIAVPTLISSAQAAVPLRISTSWSNDPKYSTARIWYDLFLPNLKAATGDQLAPQFFPDSQLGQEADVMGQMKSGVVDIMINGSSIWSNIVPEFGVFDLGYSIRDYAHLRRLTATPAVADLQKKLLEKGGVHIPSWLRPTGARHILSKTGFKDSAGLARQKIRTIPNKTVTETISLMGAAATPLAFGEIYTALQAGVLDGVEHDAPTILTSKFFETAKHLTLTGHLIQPILVTLSDRSLQRLKPELRTGLLTALQRTTDDVYRVFAEVEARALDDLKKLGVSIDTCDRDAFRAKVKPLWDQFVKDNPGAKTTFDAIRQTENA